VCSTSIGLGTSGEINLIDHKIHRNQWSSGPAISEKLRSRLDEPNVRALNLLQEMLDEAIKVKTNENGDIVCIKDNAEFTVHVVGSLKSRLIYEDQHLLVTVKAQGYPLSEKLVCIEAAHPLPVADHIVPWIGLVESGWPSSHVIEKVRKEIVWADWYVNESREAGFERFAEECAGGLITLNEGNIVGQRDLFNLRKLAYIDAEDGVGITGRLLEKTVILAGRLIFYNEINASDVNITLTPFLNRYSTLTINAYARELKGSPAGNVLNRYKQTKDRM